MDNKTVNEIMFEIFTEEQLDNINEASNIYIKDENGKKTIDTDKVNTEIERIKNIKDEELQKEQTKNLIKLIGSFTTLYAGIILIPINPLVSIVSSITSMIFSFFSVKPDNKKSMLISLNKGLSNSIKKLSNKYDKIVESDPKRANEIKNSINELEKQKDRIEKEIKKVS